MTVGSLLSHMGIGSKGVSERLAHVDYGGAVHDPHMIYAYEPPTSHGHHVASSKHHHGSSGHKNNSAMSALTLLAFLFFLHILQQCLREHMVAMSAPPVIVMTGGREGEESLAKTPPVAGKVDKYGPTDDNERESDAVKINNNAKQNANQDDDTAFLTKIHTEEHTPRGKYRYKSSFANNYVNRSMSFPGFVNAMDTNWD